MREAVKQAVSRVGLLIAIVVLLLIEDALLWFVPGGIAVYRQGGLQSQCSKVKPGLTREEALQVIHRGMTPQREAEEEAQGERKEHTLVFGTGNETCTVVLDPLNGTISKAEYQYTEFPPIN
ncbi:MAG: hypothetical protein LAQ69_51100 [Acidobacteriia bacterium]|nr:hypothetical protein [Terriglobia bacterium]